MISPKASTERWESSSIACYYNEDCENPEIVDLYLRKNRHGPTGRIELSFDDGRMSFSAPAPPQGGG